MIDKLEDAAIKVCDFGLSTVVKPDAQQTLNTLGSPAYAAPELPTAQHTNKVDVYSFGIVLWELFSRLPPWSDVTSVWQITERVHKGQRLPILPGLVVEVCDQCFCI